MTNEKYDTIGLNYTQLRKPDPRIASFIHGALDSAHTVLNVGAGSGNYEPTDRSVIAVEPSAEMVRKRPSTSAKAVRAVAQDLPFGDKSFDASIAILTVHHWPDKTAGLRELRRVTRGPVVLFTFDPNHRPWLTDYLPGLIAIDDAQMPRMSEYARWLGKVETIPVPVPHDCSDGFLYAYWRRPMVYLDPLMRTGASAFWALDNVEEGLHSLQRDIESGEWTRRYEALLELDAYDAGYRLIVAN
jgi:SAM-dependent methyltransferase